MEVLYFDRIFDELYFSNRNIGIASFLNISQLDTQNIWRW